MNISKREQRVLHALAQGGCIRHERSTSGKLLDAECVTREGARLADFDLRLFDRLRRRGFVRSNGGSPYRISRAGREAVRPQLDNR